MPVFQKPPNQRFAQSMDVLLRVVDSRPLHIERFCPDSIGVYLKRS